MKKVNTVKRALKTPVTIGEKVIDEIHFDLLHINYGWNKILKDYNLGGPRSNYTEEEIVNFFEQLNFLIQEPKEQPMRLKTVEKRFVFYIFDGKKRLKMVIDLLKNMNTVVVTIY